jgi:Ran GTPase-activating protein (RanGAP) involved in mRNA processing and transport
MITGVASEMEEKSVLDWDIYDLGVPYTQGSTAVCSSTGQYAGKGQPLLREMFYKQEGDAEDEDVLMRFNLVKVKKEMITRRGPGGDESNKDVREQKVERNVVAINLKGYIFSSEQCYAFAEVLKVNTTIETLKIAPPRKMSSYPAWWEMTEDSACSIIQAMGKNTSILNLELEKMRFGEGGADLLASMLRTNKSCLELGLNDCSLKRREAEEISLALRYNTTLKRLSVARNDLESQGGEALVSFLEENSTLESLNLFKTGITTDVVGKIAGALRTNANIRLNELYLGCHKFEGSAFQELSSALQVCTTLKTLNLHFSILINSREVCEKHLAVALGSGKCSLTRLDLSRNSMSSKGVEGIFVALTKNSTLKHLNISSNNFFEQMKPLDLVRLPSRVALSCRKMLEGNTTLESINVQTCLCGEQDTKEVVKAFPKNKTLRELKGSWLGDVQEFLLERLIAAPRLVPLMLDENDVQLKNSWRFLLRAGLKIPNLQTLSNEAIAKAIHEMWLEKLLAFAMGYHKRLGGAQGGGAVASAEGGGALASPVYRLGDSLIALVGEMFMRMT